LLSGNDVLRSYTFNTHTARHLFCSVCGIKSFYVPRSHPDGISVNARCIDSGTIGELESRRSTDAGGKRNTPPRLRYTMDPSRPADASRLQTRPDTRTSADANAIASAALAPNRNPLDEYKHLGDDLRHYGILRLYRLTLMLGTTGAMVLTNAWNPLTTTGAGRVLHAFVVCGWGLRSHRAALPALSGLATS
jgi:hypothetical protein